MSTFIIAFIIFALAGLGIRHYIKGKEKKTKNKNTNPKKEENQKANH